MAQIKRSRDGKIIDVSIEQARNYVRSGHYTWYSAQGDQLDAAEQRMRDQELGITTRPLTGSAGTGSSLGQFTSPTETLNQQQRPLANAGRDYTGDSDVNDFKHRSQLTPVERDTVNRYMKSMESNYDSWWNVSFSEPDADGNAYASGFSPIQGKAWSIEQDGQNAGWTDEMIGVVSTFFYGGPQNSIDPQTGLFGDGSGFGSGSGSGGPQYVSPMREVVEDTVKSLLIARVGKEDEGKVQEYTDKYLKAHKESWDVRLAGGEDVDPAQVVILAIRDQEDYKSIHKLRDEGESETRWIADRMQRLQQLGVGGEDAGDQAIWLAQAGTNLNDIETGQLQHSKGKKDISLVNKLKQSATTFVGQL